MATGQPLPPAWVFRSAIPKAMPINLETAFRNLDTPSRAELASLTQQRNDLVRALDAESTDAALAAIEVYLPRLIGVLRAAEGVSIELTAPIPVSYYLPFTIRFASTAAVSNSLRYEHGMVVCARALLLRKRASDLLSSCGSNCESPSFKCLC